jgi:glycosyltransferase involved in cell wall biosynthesis
MPAYNEEATIADAVGEVQRWVLAALPSAELIVVNDGSRDDTGKILERLAASEPRLRVVNQKNAGHGAALRTGLELARGEYVSCWTATDRCPWKRFRVFGKPLKDVKAHWGFAGRATIRSFACC